MCARRRLQAFLASNHPDAVLRLRKHRRFAGYMATLEIPTPEGSLLVESGCSTKPSDCYRDILTSLREDEAMFGGFEREEARFQSYLEEVAQQEVA